MRMIKTRSVGIGELISAVSDNKKITLFGDQLQGLTLDREPTRSVVPSALVKLLQFLEPYGYSLFIDWPSLNTIKAAEQLAECGLILYYLWHNDPEIFPPDTPAYTLEVSLRVGGSR